MWSSNTLLFQNMNQEVNRVHINQAQLANELTLDAAVIFMLVG
jgi:hypothetical protein